MVINSYLITGVKVNQWERVFWMIVGRGGKKYQSAEWPRLVTLITATVSLIHGQLRCTEHIKPIKNNVRWGYAAMSCEWNSISAETTFIIETSTFRKSILNLYHVRTTWSLFCLLIITLGWGQKVSAGALGSVASSVLASQLHCCETPFTICRAYSTKSLGLCLKYSYTGLHNIKFWHYIW